VSGAARHAAAGAAGTALWAALEPLDRRLLGHDYSDVALLGKWVTRGPLWPVAGVAWHLANGASFGLALHALRRGTGAEPRRLALGLALVEHVGLYPLSILVDRHHPARGERGVTAVWSKRAFAAATVRHALFGAVLGRLVR